MAEGHLRVIEPSHLIVSEAASSRGLGDDAVKTLKRMETNKVARAIEEDAGHALPGLRESLAQAKDGRLQRVHTSEQIVERSRARRMGRREEVAKEVVTIRLDADVMAALRASGDGWQSRVNDALRASLALCGKITPA